MRTKPFSEIIGGGVETILNFARNSYEVGLNIVWNCRQSKSALHGVKSFEKSREKCTYKFAKG